MNSFVKLREVCIKITDGSHYSPVGIASGIPMLSVKDMEHSNFDYSNCKFISWKDYEALVKSDCKPLKNDILIAKDGSYLKHVFVVNNEIDQAVLSSIGILRPNLKRINPYYLKYYLHTASVKEIVSKKYVSGSALPRIILKNFGEIDILNKPLLTQQKIAAVLCSLDDKIELNNRINAKLEAMAKTIYDYWFVQFDFPDKKGKPYKSSGGKIVYNEILKREIPEGWEVHRLGDYLYTSLGGTPSTKVKEFWKDGTVHWLNSGEIANFPIIDSELKITKEAIKNSATELMPKGSVLLSITRHLRPTVLAIDACANQSVVGIKEKNDIKYYFLYPYLKNEISRLMTLRTGAQQPHINKEIVDDSLIIIPDLKILKQYNETVANCYQTIMNNALQNQQLATLRDWLLPMLMNGQVSVGKAYEQVEEVLSMAAEDGIDYKKIKK